MNRAFWRGKRVLITGHTGFKGSWLALWLHRAGAKVAGYALDPPTSPNLFDAAALHEVVEDHRGDVRDAAALRAAIVEFGPEVVIHMAAQALVLESYRHPADTYATNVMGTVNLLEAVRDCRSVRTCLIVTSDKCYQPSGGAPHRESDPLGGRDPYSSSKACAEIVTSAYRASFFNSSDTIIASARAGNVVGGGDFAADRLIPDCIRAFTRGEPVIIRNPSAIRPWQHVLEPLSGYIALIDHELDGAWNFGPRESDEATVQDVLEQVCVLWGGGARWKRDESPQPAETMTLRLDATKARQQLGWRPRLALKTAIEWTVKWYAAFARDARSARKLMENDIERYEGAA